MKIVYKIVIIIVIMIVFDGLHNYRELNELAIVSSISIDKNEDGTFTLAAQIVNTKKENSGTKSGNMSSEVTVYTKNSKSIQLGLREIINESPKKLYIAHMEAIIISEDVARDNIAECVDFFIRDNETSISEKIVIAKKNTRAEDVLKIITPIENNSSKSLVKSLESNMKYEGTVIKSSLIDITDALVDDNKEILITACEIQGNNKAAENKQNLENSDSLAKLKLSNIAYFRNVNLMGYLSDNDSKVLNLLNNNIKNTIIFYYIDDKKISFEIIDVKCKLDVKFINNTINLDIDVTNNIVITEMNPMLDSDTIKNIEYIEDKTDEYLKGIIEEFINNMKFKYKSDLLNIKNILYKSDIEAHNKIKDKFYEEYLESLTYNVKVDSNLETEGGILKKW